MTDLKAHSGYASNVQCTARAATGFCPRPRTRSATPSGWPSACTPARSTLTRVLWRSENFGRRKKYEHDNSRGRGPMQSA